MITDTRITVVGNLGEDPELRFTPSGAAVATFSVAVTPRRLDKTKGEWIDGDATWYRINCWRSLAENVAESLTKGSRVIVVGTLAARSWKNETKGTEGVSWEITAEAIGPDLQWQTAKPVKSSKSRPDRDVPPPDDPWSGSAPAAGSAAQSAAAGSWGGGYSDEPPF